MPASSRNVNLQHGSNARRGRLRHQTARSNFTEKRLETERRSNKSEDTMTTNGASGGNRFAALSHTEPVPGVDLERGMQPMQTGFTFRCKNPSPTAAGTTVASSAQQSANTQVKEKVLATQPVALLSPREQFDSVLTAALLAELRVTALLPYSDNPQGPVTSSDIPPLAPLFAESSIHTLPPAVSTESLSPELDNVPSTSVLQAQDRHIGAGYPLLPSSSLLETDVPLRPRRKLILPKPKVHLPSTFDTTPSPQIAPLPTSFPASEPVAYTLTSAGGKTLGIVVEIAAETFREPLEAIPTSAEQLNSKSAHALSVDSPKRSKESSVDEMNEGGSDGEWEWID